VGQRVSGSSPKPDGVPRVSAVIVTWNAADVIDDCLGSLFDGDPSSVEAIVVDNGSTDGTVERVTGAFSDVVTIETGANLGFASAANIGIERAGGSAILLLNPDTQLLPGALRELTAALDSNPRVGAAGPRLTESNGRAHNHAAKRFPSPWFALARQIGISELLNRLGRGEGLAAGIKGSPARVPCLPGAALLVPREVFERIGYLDESLPMYLEDLDLCARIGSADLDLMYVPDSNVIHEAGHSSTRSPRRDLLFQMQIGQAPWMYLRRYRGRHAAFAYTAALLLGATLRLVALAPLVALARLSGRADGRLTSLSHRASILVQWAIGSKARFLARAWRAFAD